MALDPPEEFDRLMVRVDRQDDLPELLSSSVLVNRSQPLRADDYCLYDRRLWSGFRPILAGHAFYTDGTSCALDAVNIAMGEAVLSRELTGPGPTSYGANAGCQRTLSARRIEMKVFGGKKDPPSMEALLLQPRGVFIVEMKWIKQMTRRASHPLQDWHVIVVNADRRYVACNTLGVVPFCGLNYFTNGKETEETHGWVIEKWQIRRISRVYVRSLHRTLHIIAWI